MQKYRNIHKILIYAFLPLISGLSSCKENVFYTNSDAKLAFSANMIEFDTVFTSVNTITKVLKVRNPYKSDIKTDIVLAGGATSYFSINVDGVSARQFKDVEIPAQDSIFIFIKANINPNGVDNPMLVCDTIAFFTNGNRQNVELLAHGQDAYFIIPNDTLHIEGAQDIPYRIVADEGQEVIWKNDKPYVIYGFAVVESNAKLTIEKGARICVHKGGILWVYVDGCLEVNGTKDEPVTFQGDRLDNWYDPDYKQWDRIWICESDKDSKINYAIIKNAAIGIQAETLEAKKNNKLTISNTIIKSCQIGLLSKTYTIEAYNNVFSNCENYCAALTQGGNYTFTNNTIYNQCVVKNRPTPALFLSNYYAYSQTEIIFDNFSGAFVNNIISGKINDDNGKEFDYDYVKGAAFSASFENCLIRTKSERLTAPISEANTLLNRNPDTDSNFKLKSTSPCIKAGKYVPWLMVDIENNARSNPPSIGAYE